MIDQIQKKYFLIDQSISYFSCLLCAVSGRGVRIIRVIFGKDWAINCGEQPAQNECERNSAQMKDDF